MTTVREDTEHRSALVSDGRWGTFLVSAGLGPGQCPELWNVDHPHRARDVAKAYTNAGADIVKTNSFGGCRKTLEPYGMAQGATALNEAAARLSHEAVGLGKHVMASIGPSEKILMVRDISEDQL